MVFRITDYADELLAAWTRSTGRSAIKPCSATGSGAARAREVVFTSEQGDDIDGLYHPRPTRSGARPSWCWRRSIRWWTS